MAQSLPYLTSVPIKRSQKHPQNRLLDKSNRNHVFLFKSGNKSDGSCKSTNMSLIFYFFASFSPIHMLSCAVSLQYFGGWSSSIERQKSNKMSVKWKTRKNLSATKMHVLDQNGSNARYLKESLRGGGLVRKEGL